MSAVVHLAGPRPSVAGQVVGLVRRVLRDPAQSEEVVQEVLLEYLLEVLQEVWRTSARYRAERGEVMLPPGRLPCLAIAAGAGGLAVQRHQQAARVRAWAVVDQQQAERLTSLLTVPDARTATGTAAGGIGVGTVVWSHDRGRGLDAPR